MLERLCAEANVDAGMGLDLIDRMVQFQLGVLSCDPKAIATRMKRLLKHPFSKYVEEKGLPKLENIGLAKVRENVLKGGGKKASFAKKMLQRVKRVYDSMDEEDKAYLHAEAKKHAKKMAKKTFLKGGAKVDEDCDGDGDCDKGLQCTRTSNGVCYVPKQKGEDCDAGRCDKKQNLVCSTATKKCVVRGEGKDEMVVSDNFKPKISTRELQQVRNEGHRFAGTVFLVAFVVLVLYGMFYPKGIVEWKDTVNSRYDGFFQIGLSESIKRETYRTVRKGTALFGIISGSVLAAGLYLNPVTGVAAAVAQAAGLGVGGVSSVAYTDYAGSVVENSLVDFDYATRNPLRVVFFGRLMVIMYNVVRMAYTAWKNSDALMKMEFAGVMGEGIDLLQSQVSAEWATTKFVLLQALPNLVSTIMNRTVRSIENAETRQSDQDVQKFRIANEARVDIEKEKIRAASPKKESPGCILPENGKRCRKIKDGEEDDGKCVWNSETNRCNKKKRRRAAEETKEEYHAPALPNYDDDDLAGVD